MWIELHQSVWTHRKTIELAGLLDIEADRAVAHCARLWTWALDNAPEGVLSTCTARVIAVAAQWQNDPDTFVQAMMSAGFIDADMTLHNWFKYAGKLIERRRANANRMRERRSEGQKPIESKATRTRATHVQRTTSAREKHVRECVELPNRTGPNQTNTGNTPSVSPSTGELPAALFAPDGAATKTTGAEVDSLAGAGGAESEKKPAKRSKARTPAPEITPTADMYAWAREHFGFDERTVNRETLKMLDHHRAKGSLMADWSAAWRTWMRNAVEFSRGKKTPTPIRKVLGAPAATREWTDEEKRMQAEVDRLVAGGMPIREAETRVIDAVLAAEQQARGAS